jgi:hypothetical protein
MAETERRKEHPEQDRDGKPATIGSRRRPATSIPDTSAPEYDEVTPEVGHLPEGENTKE